MTRLPFVRIAAVLLLTASVYGRTDDQPYTQVSRLPSVVASASLNTILFDHLTRRLYAPTVNGVYWVDVKTGDPQLKGPLLPRRPGAVAIAPDLGRLYFASQEGFGYVNLRANATPTMLVSGEWRGGRLAYEPARKEIYAPVRTRGEVMAVHHSETGQVMAQIQLPGFRVTRLEAVPGKVFFAVENKFGLYVIDAATRAVSPWRVNGRVIEPGRLEVEPTGEYMITSFEHHVVAIDIPSATVIAQLPVAGLADFAFDPERRLVVVATNEPPDHPRVRMRVYALRVGRFVQVAELKSPEEDSGGLVSLHGGFLQRAHGSLLLWRANPQ